MYLIFETAKIALIANTSQHHEMLAYDLNGGYSEMKVEKSDIPKGYEVFDKNLYHLDIIWKQQR